MADFATPYEIQKVVLDALPRRLWAPNMQAYFGADAWFYLPTVQEVDAFLQYYLNLPQTGLGEGFDCDDYAYAAKGLSGIWNREYAKMQASWCVGVIFARFAWPPFEDHAANWFVDKSFTPYLFEPQTRKIYAITDCQSDIKLLLL
jgi:hypothetical protein